MMPVVLTKARPPTSSGDLNATIVDTAASLILVLNPAGEILRFNHACETATGYAFEQVQGRVFWELLLEGAEAAAVQKTVSQILAGHFPRSHENDLLTSDGRKRRIVWSTSAVLDQAGKVELIVACGNDITDRRSVELKLRESEERYALAVRGANDGLWDWDLKTDRLHLSSRWRAMLGVGEGEVAESPDYWFARIHPEDLNRLRQAIEAHLDGTTPHVEVEHRVQHHAGHWRWMLARGLAIRDAAGAPYRMAGSLTDITDRKSAEEKLVRDALYDSLTGLANRVLLLQRLQHTLDRSHRRDKLHFALLFLDLDRFKVINDGLGHVVGDQLLCEFAKRLGTCVRPADTVARLGGDEFVILLEDIVDDTDASRVAERIHEVLKLPFIFDDHEVFTSASIGIAPGSPRYRNVQDLLRDADAAMYRAKALGKSRHEMFDAAMHEKAMEVLKLETDLRRAIERQEFLLHYQPIVSLADGSLRGFESLVRWRHPDRGMVSPAVFIPMMEETGLIVPLGAWVIQEACRQLKVWQDRFSRFPSLGVSINVSGKQFAKADLVAEVGTALRQTNLPGKCVTLEITESVMMTNADAAAATLRELRARGANISVDDFGVGYSSLSQLHRFPIDALKIDRSFLQRIGGEERDAEIIRTIVTLAHNLNLTVTAEGIETPLQLERLRALGCESGQGYFFAKPLSVEQVEAMLAAETTQTQSGRLAG
jgi:diguanylate cyclase (GGDEF)-like protein/PAS domain S-box-containing protein